MPGEEISSESSSPLSKISVFYQEEFCIKNNLNGKIYQQILKIRPLQQSGELDGEGLKGPRQN